MEDRICRKSFFDIRCYLIQWEICMCVSGEINIDWRSLKISRWHFVHEIVIGWRWKEAGQAHWWQAKTRIFPHIPWTNDKRFVALSWTYIFGKYSIIILLSQFYRWCYYVVASTYSRFCGCIPVIIIVDNKVSKKVIWIFSFVHFCCFRD